MKHTFKIEPKQGFGALKFGTEMEKVVKDFGEPEEVDNFENDDDINAVLLHYWENGFSVLFQGDTRQVVAGIETDNPDATLYGQKVIGMTEKQVSEMMKAHSYEEYDRETDKDEVRLFYEEEMIDFYLRDNKVAFVNWDVLIDEDGNITE